MGPTIKPGRAGSKGKHKHGQQHVVIDDCDNTGNNDERIQVNVKTGARKVPPPMPVQPTEKHTDPRNPIESLPNMARLHSGSSAEILA